MRTTGLIYNTDCSSTDTFPVTQKVTNDDVNATLETYVTVTEAEEPPTGCTRWMQSRTYTPSWKKRSNAVRRPRMFTY